MSNISPPLKRTAAFTLIELLVVTSIIVILVSLVVPAMSTLQRAGALTRAGNMLVDAVILARETASSRNTFSCIVVTSPNTLPQRVAILEYRADDSEWHQITPWSVVPEAIRVEDLTSTTVSDAARASVNQIATLDLKVAGDQVASDVSVVLFRPEAGVGFAGGHRFSARSSQSAEGSTPDNFYDVVINPESKAHHVVRP
jgi:prepilin-type N-terminal cleavage/methylation domain-containing protein